jgi:death-on-curing protein
VTDPIEYLDLDDVLALAERLLGEGFGVRDVGLLGSAVARPQTTVDGQDAYPDVWSKAAALLQSVVNNHALVDGNKRLGWLATAVFLELNDIGTTHASNDAIYELVMTVASTHVELTELARRLRGLVDEAERDQLPRLGD